MGGDGLEDGGPGGGGVVGVVVEGEEDVDCAGEGKEEEEEGCYEGMDVHYGGRDGWRWGGVFSRIWPCVAYNGTDIPTRQSIMLGEILDHLYWKLP